MKLAALVKRDTKPSINIPILELIFILQKTNQIKLIVKSPYSLGSTFDLSSFFNQSKVYLEIQPAELNSLNGLLKIT